MCVEYGEGDICGMWCLTKNCCTCWAECSDEPWDKLHWHMYHHRISLKPPGKKKCPDPPLFSNWLISNFLSPHLILQLSLHLILFDEGCIVCSSLSMNMHPSLKWQNHSKHEYESITASLENQFHHVIRFGSCFLEFCKKSYIQALLHIPGHHRYDV